VSVSSPSAPTRGSQPPRRWFLRPRVVLPAILVLIVLVALLTPEEIRGRSGDARLTTYSASPQGARLLYELAQRLGWRVERWTETNMLPSDPNAVVAVLEPWQPLGAIETHRLLEHVRAGGGLLYVMNGRGPLNDSLHVKRGLLGGTYRETPAGSADASSAKEPARRDTAVVGASDSLTTDSSTTSDEEEEASATPPECAKYSRTGGALPMWDIPNPVLYQFDWVGARPAHVVMFALADLGPQRSDSSRKRSSPAAAGFPLGRGRVVVVSDADFFRNDVLRVCRWGVDVATVRMLEYVSDGDTRRERLVFDEYHQGYGAHPGTLRAIVTYLSRAPSGHVLAQGLAAGLVLLLALGPRALAPRDEARVERRSPLEHVSALAHAYARVAATRTASRQLLRGVRRRVERTAQGATPSHRAESDEHFLDAIARDTPALAPDSALVRRALSHPLAPRAFEAAGAALRRIESSLLSLRR
jgi:hypothetical protein